VSLTLAELERALGEMDSGKERGINGIPPEFNLEFWDLLGPEVLNIFQESLQSGLMPLRSNAGEQW